MSEPWTPLEELYTAALLRGQRLQRDNLGTSSSQRRDIRDPSAISGSDDGANVLGNRYSVPL